MTERTTTGLAAWTTREIVLAAVLSAIFGALFMAWALLWDPVTNLIGPFGGEIIYGFWFIAAIIVPYIVRRPGAAIAAETLAAAVELLLGSPWGIDVIISGLIQGGAAELVFAAGRWRSYRLPILMAAGGAAAIASFIHDYYLYGYAFVAPLLIIVGVVIRIASGAILAGWLAKALGDGLARTGVLEGFAITEEA